VLSFRGGQEGKGKEVFTFSTVRSLQVHFAASVVSALSSTLRLLLEFSVKG